ncbi:hypothetical protein NC651_007137 [Populus alba x Populus x berolinensis]|nr:hypothetical protein NC651_007137 [Populus alba x Populus x berolinensis]
MFADVFFYALLEPLSKLIHAGHLPTTWWWENLTILRRDLQLVGDYTFN